MDGPAVSDDLNALLHRIVGDLPQETEETKRFLTDEARAAGFSRCTWWGGCYYCHDPVTDRWHLIYCGV